MTSSNTTQSNVFYPVANAAASTNPFVDEFQPRDPTPNDVNYPTQKKWLNTIDQTFWELQNFVTSNGIVTANWIKIGSVGLTETLTGNSGGAVPATANNINVLGTGSITTVGTPATSTLTIELTGLTNHAVLVGAGTPTITNVGPTATVGQVLQSQGSSADPAFSTATYPSTTTVDQILYSSATNTVTGLATGNDGVLITSNTGVPSFLANGTTGQVLTATTGLPPSWQNSVANAINQVKNQVFSTSGTYTPTSGMVYCSVICVGGGGGGGGANNAGTGLFNSAGGGGAGEFATGIFSAATIGASKTVTIGAAGAGGIGNLNGGSGGTTSLGSLITAVGGGGGGTDGADDWGVSGPGGTGGTGGDWRVAGCPGTYGAGYSNTAGGYAAIGGNGGSTLYGGGGIGNHATVNGGAATGYGGGGSGGSTANGGGSVNGGAGFTGVVIITEYIS